MRNDKRVRKNDQVSTASDKGTWRQVEIRVSARARRWVSAGYAVLCVSLLWQGWRAGGVGIGEILALTVAAEGVRCYHALSAAGCLFRLSSDGEAIWRQRRWRLRSVTIVGQWGILFRLYASDHRPQRCAVWLAAETVSARSWRDWCYQAAFGEISAAAAENRPDKG